MTKFIRYTLLASLLLSASACGDNWLFLTPQDSIINEEFWKTKEQVSAAIIGCYASLLGNPSSSDKDRTLTEYLFLWGELRGDMIALGASALQEEIDMINGNLLSSNVISNWRSVYRTINYCNTVIQNAPKVQETDKTFKTEELNAYLAEARSLRALLYFYLLRTFKEVPLKTDPTTSDAEIVNLPKSSEGEIMDQILSDLRWAEQNAVTTYGNRSYDKGRITRYTVNAIQADAYLWREQYDSCIIACDKIIGSGQFGLVSRFDDWFTSIFVNGNSNEGIFEFQFDAQKTNTFYQMMVSPQRLIASASVLELDFTINYVNSEDQDIRADGASVRASGMIWKYIGLTSTRQRTLIESYAHWIVYRYAEILLFKAEALAQIGRGQEALALVDEIRTRANALATTLENPDPEDVSGVSDYILRERKREFAFEGKRWFDVLRHSKRNNYSRIDIMIQMAVFSAPIDRQQSIVNKIQDFNSHYLPIYQNEIQANKSLVQNPFYLK